MADPFTPDFMKKSVWVSWYQATCSLGTRQCVDADLEIALSWNHAVCWLGATKCVVLGPSRGAQVDLHTSKYRSPPHGSVICGTQGEDNRSGQKHTLRAW